MMQDSAAISKVYQIHLELSRYPILAKRIRHLMRKALFERGIVSQGVFEQNVEDRAILSQQHEGMDDPFGEETSENWKQRIDVIRDQLTDFYFAYNLPHDLLHEIVADLLAERNMEGRVVLTFNPELAPWDMLIAQGEVWENYPPEQRHPFEHHLREVIVVLIKAMISDQLAFISVARKYLTIGDLKEIRAHRIGRGKIGGKAAGLMLAHKVIQRLGAEGGIDAQRLVTMPESWFLSSDVFYDFHASNDLFGHMNQKYKQRKAMIADYPAIYDAYLESELPEDIQRQLARLLEQVGNVPLIVRSSSLLEDNFDTSFAGKYDSFFLGNQGSPEQNLRALLRAITKIYASVVRPDALIYRERMGLTDYDERMAILIQKVEGERYGRYFFPALSGVGFSHNPFRWNTRIRSEDGLLRIVLGLGTRAVDRVGSDYPRMVALSHPTLRPESSSRMVRSYSQQQIDVIDLEDNTIKTLPVQEVIQSDYSSLGVMISVDQDGMLNSLARRPLALASQDMVVTFDRLLADQEFITLTRAMLKILEEAYERPVDIEFAGHFPQTYPEIQTRLVLLQCRPQSRRREDHPFDFPDQVSSEDILFTAHDQVPQGIVEGIRYLVYVDPRSYAQIHDPQIRIELGKVVHLINDILPERTFALMGPGRWGSSNISLGVRVTYSDIYKTAVLIEVAYEDQGNVPEISYGTHFFQDLVEANIYPLPLFPDDPETIFPEEFLRDAENHLTEILPEEESLAPYIKVIDLLQESGGRYLTIAMDSEQKRAVAYFA